ncbi:MAG TPA: hypothetical protein VIG29_15765 [Vicinamibacteria bacterium]
MQREPLHHGWIWFVYLVLFGAAVPWYLPDSASRPVWPGFPLWVSVSLAATVALAGFTAFVIHRYWDEDEP